MSHGRVRIDSKLLHYDWHVRNRQPINAARLSDGRYGLTILFTTVVLRPDQGASFIGWGYDVR